MKKKVWPRCFQTPLREPPQDIWALFERGILKSHGRASTPEERDKFSVIFPQMSADLRLAGMIDQTSWIDAMEYERKAIEELWQRLDAASHDEAKTLLNELETRVLSFTKMLLRGS